MTHAEVVNALRNDVETHCDVYTNSRRGHQAHGQQQSHGVSEARLAAAGGHPSHATRPEEAYRDGRGASPTPDNECGCGHRSGDHQRIRGAGMFARQSGRCLYCECSGFTEPTLRTVPGTNGRRHV
jgi:hypothetical protein